METKNQDRISELVEKQKDTYTSMADEIWGYAEPRFQEYESSRVQQEYLASRGFSIRADLAGEKTAFIAEWGSGKPVLAFLGEFDALSSLQQEADCTERRPIAGKTDGYGRSGMSGNVSARGPPYFVSAASRLSVDLWAVV